MQFYSYSKLRNSNSEFSNADCTKDLLTKLKLSTLNLRIINFK